MKIDGRKLKTETQQQLRYTAIELRKRKLTYFEIAEALGVHFATVGKWCRIYKKHGHLGLKIKKRGVKIGTNLRLSLDQTKILKKIIIDKTPDQLKLHFYLWTRKAIQVLILKLWKINIPMRTLSDYMKRLGFSPQRPLKKAYQQDPIITEKWVKKIYPSIKKKAKKEKAQIHWVDETGLRSNINYLRSYAPKGKTPILKTSGTRMHVNIISSVTNQGKLRFMTYIETMNSKRLIEFIGRLIRSNSNKIIVILDNLRVHHSKHFRSWLENKKEKIEVFYLPSYAPELNPDERLNRDLKMNFRLKHNPKIKKNLEKTRLQI